MFYVLSSFCIYGQCQHDWRCSKIITIPCHSRSTCFPYGHCHFFFNLPSNSLAFHWLSFPLHVTLFNLYKIKTCCLLRGETDRLQTYNLTLCNSGVFVLIYSLILSLMICHTNVPVGLFQND